jgi:hypothetical protein
MDLTAELKLAETFLKFDPWEIHYFKQDLIDLYSNYPELPKAKESSLFPQPNLLEDMNRKEMILMIAIYRIYYSRVLNYVWYFCPTEKIFKSDINVKSDNKRFTNELRIFQNKSIVDDALVGDILSDASKEYSRLFGMIDNAVEINVRLHGEMIRSVQIKTKSYGSFLVISPHLKILNDLKTDGNDFLGNLKVSRSYKTKDDFDRFKKLFMPFHKAQETFIFGKRKSSLHKDFILSLRPLYKYIKEGFDGQNCSKFKNYTNRRCYKYIIELLKIPEDLIDIYDMEFYLKRNLSQKDSTQDRG